MFDFLLRRRWAFWLSAFPFRDGRAKLIRRMSGAHYTEKTFHHVGMQLWPSFLFSLLVRRLPLSDAAGLPSAVLRGWTRGGCCFNAIKRMVWL